MDCRSAVLTHAVREALGLTIRDKLLAIAAGRRRALKSEVPSTPSTTASPSMTNCLSRFFSADSIHGKRLV
jgi:hypothetical protein